MKNKFLMAFTVAFTMVFGVYADAVTAEQAMAAAEAWSAENNGAFGVNGTAVKAVADVDSNGVVQWYAVQMSNGGCVFTAADSRIGPVIAAVADSDGSVPEEHPLRAMLSRDIQNRLAAVESVSGSGALKTFAASSGSSESDKIKSEVASSEEKWGRYTQGEVGKMPVLKAFASTVDGSPAKILGYVRGFSNKLYTHWNQQVDDYSLKDADGTEHAPIYNYYTPYHWVCGCVATMGAAVVQTFNITNSPVAVTNQCLVNGMPTNLVTVGGVLDWSILPTSIGGSMKNMGTRVYTDAQRELLGRVTYDMGVLIGMSYTQLESGAQMSPFAVSLTNHWGFTSAEYFEGGLFGIPESLFEPLIYSQLRTGYPVCLGIVSPMGGHAVLAVGYGEDAAGTAYTRVFMGWGGKSDAWYQLPKIGAYSLIGDAVTMLSTDENVVPVSGKVLLPDGRPAAFAEVKIPSAPAGEIIRTGANGWFSTRIPKAAVADEEVTATLNGMSGTATYTVGEEITDPYSFYTAVPAALTIRLSGEGDAIPYYYSPEEACSAALEEGKVILVLSGDNGEEKTEFLKSYFATNDVASFNEKCVLYYAEKDLDSYGWQDGVPSIGLFAPSLFSTEGLWLPDNGRFWYIDYTDKEIDLDELQDAILEAYENNVDLEHWIAAQKDDVRFSVSGLTPTKMVGYMGYDQVFAGSPDVGYGEYVNCYTNGEEVIIKGSEFMTNSVIWKCKGWYVFDNDYEPSDLEVHDWLSKQEAKVPWLVASGDGAEIRFNAVAGSNWSVYWMWEPVMYKVAASAKNGKIISINGVTGITEAWFNAGDVVTICAAPNESSVSGRIYEFKGWSGSSDGGFSGDEKLGTTINVLVSSDRELTATFELSKGTAFLGKYNISVDAQAQGGGLPAGSDPLPSTYVGGVLVANGAVLNVYQGEVSIVPSSLSYTDATGGVWKCVGWSNGSGSISSSGTNAYIPVNITSDSSFTWLWELQEAQEEFVIPPIVWSDDLDNLSSDKPFMLAEASTIPAGFDINDLIPLAAPTGWVATPKIDPTTGDLVAELTLNEEALKPIATDDAPAVITIVPNADGSLTVKASVANGLRGFWYAIYGAETLVGPWSLVKVFQAGGTALEQADQAEEVGEVRLSITVDSNGSQQFYKLVVLESAPE